VATPTSTAVKSASRTRHGQWQQHGGKSAGGSSRGGIGGGAMSGGRLQADRRAYAAAAAEDANDGL